MQKCCSGVIVKKNTERLSHRDPVMAVSFLPTDWSAQFCGLKGLPQHKKPLSSFPTLPFLFLFSSPHLSSLLSALLISSQCRHIRQVV